MFKKNTGDLINEITKENDISKYFDDNQDELIKNKFYEVLNDYIIKLNISKAEIIEKCNLNKTYGYEILRGNKMPSRDKVISLAIGLGLSLEETQRFLKLSGNRELYPRDKKDALILHGIAKKNTLSDINELLFDNNFEIL